MRPEKFDELLRNYRVTKARIAYLRSQIETHERFLKICTDGMINDMVSLSQAITGMPHGSGTGDPTGRLAMDIESGKVSPFVQELQETMAEMVLELNKIAPEARAVEIALGAIGDRERALITMKIIDEFSWDEVIHKFNNSYGGKQTKRTLQRMIERAMQKVYEVVR